MLALNTVSICGLIYDWYDFLSEDLESEGDLQEASVPLASQKPDANTQVCISIVTFSLLCVSVQMKQNTYKNMNSIQQQREYHHQKVLIESFHLSGHTFRFRWTVQDLEVFLV